MRGRKIIYFMGLLGLLSGGMSVPVLAGATHLSGKKIINYTSNRVGIYIMLEGKAVPDNCVGTAYGWLAIRQEDTAMMATFFNHWNTARDAPVTVYTDTLTGSICVINQLDPQ